MANWMKGFLWLISCLLISSCSVYKNLTPVAQQDPCTIAYKYRIAEGQYVTQIDVYKKHLSGLMVFKKTANGAMRAVFTNEMGFKFFDLEFGLDSFKVVYMLSKMNKPLIVKTLRKDLGMLCAPNRASHFEALEDKVKNEMCFRAAEGKDFLYYFADPKCANMFRIERGNKRKPLVVATVKTSANGIMTKVLVKHKNIKLSILLGKIEQ
jgi:hypothetical protein